MAQQALYPDILAPEPSTKSWGGILHNFLLIRKIRSIWKEREGGVEGNQHSRECEEGRNNKKEKKQQRDSSTINRT